jgi:hypothetical protein
VTGAVNIDIPNPTLKPLINNAMIDHKKRLYTLVFVRQPGRVLLGMKKRGFGQGKWNGFGGKVEPNEEVTTAAVRELRVVYLRSLLSFHVILCSGRV